MSSIVVELLKWPWLLSSILADHFEVVKNIELNFLASIVTVRVDLDLDLLPLIVGVLDFHDFCLTCLTLILVFLTFLDLDVVIFAAEVTFRVYHQPRDPISTPFCF